MSIHPVVPSGKIGSPEFIENQGRVAEVYRLVRIDLITQNGGFETVAIDNEAYRIAKEAWPFRIVEELP